METQSTSTSLGVIDVAVSGAVIYNQNEASYTKGVEHGIKKVWYPTGELQKELKYHLGLE